LVSNLSYPTVCFLCFDFREENFTRQPWNYIYNLALGCKNKGIAVYVISTKKKSENSYQIIEGLNIIRFSQFQSITKGISRSVLQCLKIINPSCIFTLLGPTSFFQIQKIPKEMNPVAIIGVPFQRISFLQFLKLNDITESWKLILSLIVGSITPRFLIRRYLEHYSYIITITKDTYNELCRIGVNPRKVKEISVGFDIDVEISEDRDSSATMITNKPYILFFGSPLSIRGCYLLVRMFELLHKEIQDVHLVYLLRLENERLYRNKTKLLKEIERAGLSNRIRVISDPLTKRDLFKYIKQSLFIILPFKLIMSAFPISILESMSLEKVVISSNLPGIRQVLSGNKGCLIRPGNIEDLVHYSKVIIENASIRISIGKEAKYYINNNHPKWRDSIEEILNIIMLIDSSSNKKI